LVHHHFTLSTSFIDSVLEDMKDTVRIWQIFTNALMALGWLRVLVFFVWTFLGRREVTFQPPCNDEFVPMLHLALMISFLEVFNSVTGVTRSKPAQALLFAVIRFGVETVVAPVLPTCPSAWSHVFTVLCWSLGDSVRFGCFFFDSLNADGSRLAKYLRYLVGPVLFPLGTLGEMIMVLTWARQTFSTNVVHSLALYIAALCLWPLGFYSLFTQLLRQRRKFLQQSESSDKKIR
jgi:very-long-chain (3R)-3-hydroxyacyl-CoA dehydratase